MERQTPIQQKSPKARQSEQLQDEVAPWEQTTPDWGKETYDLEVGPPIEGTPVGHPETGQTPGTWTEQNVEQHPGSMPQINTDLEMEQDNSSMTGYVQPDFAVKEVDYENGVLTIVIMNIGRRINPPDCPQMAVAFGINGVDNTEQKIISQCMERERVINTNLAIDWQETDGKKICWVKLDPDSVIQELDKSNNNFEAPVYRTKEPDVNIIGRKVKIAESGKTLGHGDQALLENGDIADSINENRIFALNLTCDLINYGAQAINFDAQFRSGSNNRAAVYSANKTTQRVRLEPGERKTIIQPVWYHFSTCGWPVNLTIGPPQNPLKFVNTSMGCSESIQEWIGASQPDVVILNHTLPSRIKIHERAEASVTIANKGGNLFDREKWDLHFDIFKNNGGTIIFHKAWTNLKTPRANNDFTKIVNFVLTETGYYTYRIRGSSRGGIFDSNCYVGKREITRKISFLVSE
jgi:hypothetical protein